MASVDFATLSGIETETQETAGTMAGIQPRSSAMHKRIHKVAVLGAGTMGSRIAAHLANAGVPSFLLDIVPPGADAASRNKIALAGLEAARKAKPAAFYEPSISSLITPGNFDY